MNKALFFIVSFLVFNPAASAMECQCHARMIDPGSYIAPCSISAHTAFNGDVGKMRDLMKAKNFSVDEDDFRYSLLGYAAAGGHVDMLKFLLTHKANINLRTQRGSTALHAAARHGKVAATQLLLTHNAQTNLKDREGHAPLHFAVVNRHLEITQLLLHHGAYAKIHAIDGSTPLEYARLPLNLLRKCRIFHRGDKAAWRTELGKQKTIVRLIQEKQQQEERRLRSDNYPLYV